MTQLQSEDISKLAEALVELQYALEGVKKDSANDYFKSKYADLHSCQGALREPLYANGLAVTQTTRTTESGAVLVTTLVHKSGQWIKGELPLAAKKADDPQAQGSAITYARRYALCAITGLCQMDDDAEAAMQRKDTKKEPAHKPLPEKLDPQQIAQLFTAGYDNGWTDPQIVLFLTESLKTKPEDLTQKQWEAAVKVLGRPENSNGRVTHSSDGKLMPAEKHWPPKSQAPTSSNSTKTSPESTANATAASEGATTGDTGKRDNIIAEVFGK